MRTPVDNIHTDPLHPDPCPTATGGMIDARQVLGHPARISYAVPSLAHQGAETENRSPCSIPSPRFLVLGFRILLPATLHPTFALR